MATITLSDGRTLDVRPMYLSDKSRIVDLGHRADAEGLDALARMLAYADILRVAVSGKSWDGDLTDVTEGQLLGAFQSWSEATDEDALPLPSGTPSETP